MHRHTLTCLLVYSFVHSLTDLPIHSLNKSINQSVNQSISISISQRRRVIPRGILGGGWLEIKLGRRHYYLKPADLHRPQKSTFVCVSPCAYACFSFYYSTDVSAKCWCGVSDCQVRGHSVPHAVGPGEGAGAVQENPVWREYFCPRNEVKGVSGVYWQCLVPVSMVSDFCPNSIF